VNDTIVTVVGNVAEDPRRKNTQNGAVTNFRLASTPRRYDAGTGQYVDGSTFWVDVECWGSLSGNVAASISKGDPVLVQGALYTDSWESDAGPRSKPRIRAFAVGPNLQKGRALFTRDKAGRSSEEAGTVTPPPDGGAVEASSEPAEELRAGRDYVGTDATLGMEDADELSREPAHA
jgi:single-strand DNA-binding protein